MPQDAPLNSDAPPARVLGPYGRVVEMQTKLHRWAAADSGRRFDDLFNLVAVRHVALIDRAEVQGLRC
jgi:RNA-directed DNA polymerase